MPTINLGRVKGDKGEKGDNGTIIKIANEQVNELRFVSDPQAQISKNKSDSDVQINSLTTSQKELTNNFAESQKLFATELAKKQNEFITIYDKDKSEFDLGFPSGIERGVKVNYDLRNYKILRFFVENQKHTTHTIIDLPLTKSYRDVYASGGASGYECQSNLYIYMFSRIIVDSNKETFYLDGTYFYMDSTTKTSPKIDKQTQWIARIEGILS